MKSEMTMLAGEITVLRARVGNGSLYDDALRTKCTKLALENESFCVPDVGYRTAAGSSPAWRGRDGTISQENGP